MERTYCQSCGMPLVDVKEIGTNEDGSKNKDYCTYCFENGDFKGNMTMEQMVEFCVPHMVKANNMSEEDARGILQKFLPTLKRWKLNK